MDLEKMMHELDNLKITTKLSQYKWNGKEGTKEK